MKKVSMKLKKAFSMIEVVFVIIILGIVSSIGAEIIANMYDSYIIQRAQHRASLKTELAANQIANRMAYAIPGTVIRRSTAAGVIEDIDTPLTLAGDSYDVIQWVGYDADSFNTVTDTTSGSVDFRPGWNGFCDLNASQVTGANSLVTPGSNLGLANTIIQNLSSISGASARNINNANIFFTGYETVDYNISAINTATSTITLGTNPARRVEQYKLAWTSYALQVVNGDLILHYNFEPDRAAPLNATRTKTLLRNVTTFKFKGDGRTVRFKICKSESIGEDADITSCKEKAVF